MKISELIKTLEVIQEKEGDRHIPLYLGIRDYVNEEQAIAHAVSLCKEIPPYETVISIETSIDQDGLEKLIGYSVKGIPLRRQELPEILDKMLTDVGKNPKTGKKPGYVYFMKSEMTGLVKIGFSVDPEKRRTHMLTADPSIKILCTVKGDTGLETHAHKQFEQFRKKREWFDLPDDIIQDTALLEELLLEQQEKLENQQYKLCL